MKRTALATAVAVAIGGGAFSAAQANTTGLTGVWSGTYTFAMSSANGGAVGVPTSNSWTWDFGAGTVDIVNTATFYASVWTASGVSFVDNGGDYGPNPAGTQNMTFSWSVNPSIPVTSSWDVEIQGPGPGPGTGPGNPGDTAVVTVNNATILPTSSAFPGFHPNFSGSLTKVPVPAAVWLFGSGLIGLVGVARRRRNKA